MATPYHFIKHGNLYMRPVVQAPQIPYLAQPIEKPREFSLWVHGKIDEPPFQLDSVRMPPSLYQEVRNDLVRYSPVEVSRSAFQRSNHAYTGVIDSKGKPYYFALDSRGMSVREVNANDESVWKTFDRLADQERLAANTDRRATATKEVQQMNRELSAPVHKSFDKKKTDGTPIKRPSLYQKLRGAVGKPRTDITDEGDDAPVLPKAKLVIKAGHTGTMVALHIPHDTATQVAIPGGEPPESMHVTVAYLGKNLTEEQKSSALTACRRITQKCGPIKALLGGVGRFSASHTSEGKDVIYLSVDSPDLTRMHAMLIDELAAEGIAPSNAHGYVPHVTLAYVDTSAPHPLKRFPPVAVEFPSLSLTVADEKMMLPFTSPALVIKADRLTKAIKFHAAPDGSGSHSDETPHGTYEVHSKPKALGIGKKHVLMYYPFKKPGDKNWKHENKLSTHSTIAGAHAAAAAHHAQQPAVKSLSKALPKKAKEEKVKKTPSKGASKKKAGAGGKTRYTYPSEKLGAGGKGKPGGGQQPLVVVRHDDSKNADPNEFANQLGVSVRTLQRCAKKLGREGFSKFMRSHLKRFSAKHRLDPDYWGTLYGKLQPGVD